jgi:hypothetical protein
MARVSAKGVLVGGVLDVGAAYALSIPLMRIAIVQLKLLELPEAQFPDALTKAMAPGSSYYLAGLLLGSGCSILGGYVAARLAKHDERLNGALSAWLGMLLGIYNWASGDSADPGLEHIGYLVLTPAMGVLGGYLSEPTGSTSPGVRAVLTPNRGPHPQDALPARWPAGMYRAPVRSLPTPLSPEEADRIAIQHYALWQGRVSDGYRITRVAELPDLKKFYYHFVWTLGREPTNDDLLSLPLGSAGFFVSLSTGEIEDIGSGDSLAASVYLRTRDQLPPEIEPSDQEMAAVLARYCGGQLMAMCQEIEQKQKGGVRNYLRFLHW